MENQYALITGASSGIGLQIAHQLAQKGFGIILTARREDRLRELSQELAEKYNVKTDFISSDLAEPNAPHEIHSFCKDKNYDVEVLVIMLVTLLNLSFIKHLWRLKKNL